ncbi:MAG: flagellar basal body P-ring formation chaperone FlgA [Fibrobacterales bacterium]
MKRVFSAVILILLIAVVTEAEVSIRFKDRVTVDGTTVMLTDIAEITGDPMRVEQLASVEVGANGKPGRVLTVRTGTIKQFFINPIVPLKEINFFNEGTVVVEREADYLSSAFIEDTLRTFIEKKYKENTLYEVTFQGVPKTTAVPKSDWYLKIDAGERFDVRGRELLYLEIIHKGAIHKRIRVKANIAVFEDVVFASRFIKRGSSVSIADLEMRNVETTNINRPLVHSFEDVAGKTMKRSLNRERMMYFSFIDEPFVVKRGVKTRLKINVGSGVIYTTAIARENGRIGDVVRVQNVNSKKMVRGTVGDDGSVWVLN